MMLRDDSRRYNAVTKPSRLYMVGDILYRNSLVHYSSMDCYIHLAPSITAVSTLR